MVLKKPVSKAVLEAISPKIIQVELLFAPNAKLAMSVLVH